MDTWDFLKQGTADLDQVLLQAPLEDISFKEWMDQTLAKQGKSKSIVVRNSCLNPTFAYQIMSGQRNAKRDKLLLLAFGMDLSVEDTSELLERGGSNPLNPHVRRDVALAYCRHRHTSVLECDKMLSNANITPLRSTFPDVIEY